MQTNNGNENKNVIELYIINNNIKNYILFLFLFIGFNLILHFKYFEKIEGFKNSIISFILFSEAISYGVLLFISTIFLLAPLINKCLTILGWFPFTAKCKGVNPSISWWFIELLQWIKNRVDCSLPNYDVQCNAVPPLISNSLQFEPFSINYLIIVGWSPCAATWSADNPWLFLISNFALNLYNNFIIFKCPLYAAKCNAV